MTPPVPNITDAEPASWRRGNRPDPSAAENELILAAKRYAEVDNILIGWGVEHPRSGPTYTALNDCWRQRRTELLEAARRMAP